MARPILKKWLTNQPPRYQPHRAAGPTRCLRRGLQPPPPTPLPAPSSDPRHRLHSPTQSRPSNPHDTHNWLRTDRVDQAGVVTLRVAGRLHHIGVGRTHTDTRVLILVQDLHVRMIHAATGELLRQLTLDPTRDYEPTGAPKGPKRKKFRTQCRFGTIPMS